MPGFQLLSAHTHTHSPPLSPTRQQLRGNDAMPRRGLVCQSQPGEAGSLSGRGWAEKEKRNGNPPNNLCAVIISTSDRSFILLFILLQMEFFQILLPRPTSVYRTYWNQGWQKSARVGVLIGMLPCVCVGWGAARKVKTQLNNDLIKNNCD